MRPPGLPVAVILLVFTSLAIQVSSAGDLYWEGEEEGSDEFLEVKEEDTGLAGHLKRFKRQFPFGAFFDALTTSSTTTTDAPQALEIATDDPDADNDVPDRDEDLDHGSGLPDRGVEQDLGDWKTLRVTFVVMEPYQTEYSNRDSEQFRNFSHTIDHSVDKLYENLPGTQKASLVRIQSRISDEFSCKVTLDIVTTGYDNLDRISQILQDHIRNRRKLDTVTVSDADFSAIPVDPGLGSGYATCRVDEIRCGDDACVPGSARCNGVTECADGSDEAGCRDFDDINQVDEDSSPAPLPACERISCSSSVVVICSEQRCDGIEDCPEGDDEQGCAIAETTTLQPKIVKEDTTVTAPLDTTTAYPVTTRPQTDAPLNCPDGFFPCDETRCVSFDSRCNNARDCFDGTDELGCDMESCAADDFRCSNGKCLEAKKRCDRVVDCPFQEDEKNCVCREDEFRCVSDSSCIEGRKRCDGVNHCDDSSDELDCHSQITDWWGDFVCRDSGRFKCGDDKCISMLLRCDGFRDCKDGSDEVGCPCSSNQWQCDAGNCITRTKRCDGRIDCPTDRSDERNCVANGKFRCRTGKVIPQYQRCNRHYDCPPGDYSDEQNCPCGDGDFQCDNGNCIPVSKHCDRTHDCQDASDERDCIYGTVCMAFQYKCTSGQCVPAESLCNGTTECGDWSDEQNCPCKRGQFHCRDDSCINIALRCNGHKDCHPAGEDEFNCGYCPSNSWQCADGSCISQRKRCDGRSDCFDRSDERSCVTPRPLSKAPPACPPDSFTCNPGSSPACAKRCDDLLECEGGEDEEDCTDCSHECDGICLEEQRICDRNPDCKDGSDELNCDHCDGPNDFRCNNGECINSNQYCNGILECADESDEIDCNTTMTSKPEECSIDEYQCRDGTCINSSFYCDGRNDCLDNSDEDNCPWYIARPSRSPDQPPCHESEFTCYDGRCITHLHRCDNIYDCMDFSDEQNCYNPGCSESQWQCESGMCIPLSAYCDGTSDCSDSTDETDCPTTPAPFYTTTSGRLPNLRPSEVSTNKPIFIDSPEKSRPGIGTNNGNNPYGNDNNYLPETNEISGNLPESGYNQPGQGYPSTSGRPEYGRPDLGGDFGGSRPDSGFNRPVQGYPTTTGRPEFGRPGGDSGFYRPGQGGGSSGNNLDSDYNRPGQGGDTTSGRPDYDNNRPGQGGDSGNNRPDYGYNRPGQDGDSGSNRPDYGYNRPGQGGDSDSNRPDYGYNRPGQGGDSESNRPDYGYNRPGQGVDTTGSRPDYDYNRPGQGPAYNRPGSQQGGDNGARPLGPDRDACERNQWRCENGPCIDSKRRCDGRVDCPFDSSDEFDCPPGSPTALNLKTYPSQQEMRNGGDVVFQCRDEGPLKTPVRWLREDGRPLKSGSTDERGRLEMNHVTTADSGVYICQAFRFKGTPNSELRVTLNVDPSPVTAASPQSACQPYEATCGNGQCIPKSAVCNNVVDCADRSDEEACHTNGKCEPNQFKCNNNKCVLKTWLCDSEDDCGDGSDEQDCGYSAPGQCKTVEYTCASRDQCVPKSFHCDGQSDCLDSSDEIGCAPVGVTQPPKPANVILNTGDTLTLNCSASGTPTPLISWRRNWGDVPEVCTSENIQSSNQVIGVLVCPNMQSEYNGAYSCEAMNNKGTTFAIPDAIVFVNKTSVCPNGYFNSEARSERECIRCFCFGESTSCRSADLFTYNMPTPLGQGGTRLVGVKNTGTGDVEVDASTIADQYYYQPLRNGAMVTKLEIFGSNRGSSNALPYLTLPETYNGNQLTSYGGHIKYKVSPHLPSYGSDYKLPDVIVKGKYQSLVHFSRGGSSAVEARLTPGNWEKPSSRGLVSATREDIMMALDNVEMILLRSSINNAGVNITDFVMESAHNINNGLGAASLVEECTCPPGYEGLSCQKCASGFAREQSGPWLGNCVRERPSCPPGTYGDPSSGYACRPCPCPLTNRENQFARTCAIGPNGNVICDCASGYEGSNCEYCARDYIGNPLVVGDSCKPRPSDQCNPVGTSHVRLPDECECKDNVQGSHCDQCKNDSFYLSKDFRQGCALCFCSGVTQQCMSSNLRRKTTTVRFNTPDLVSRVKVYYSTPLGAAAAVRYNAPVETNLTASYARNELVLTEYDRNRPAIYYWSLPINFAGNKVTSYGGYLRYTLHNVPVSGGYNSKNNAADVQLISENRLSFHYFGNFEPASDGTLEASVQFLEKGWQRPDGKEVSREHLLLALADVKAILVKATYTTNSQLASLVGASIDTAEETGDGPEALHVEQCVCPRGYVGTSCEDCATGYTRYESGLYLEHCGPCECNGHSNMCHAETGVCTNCQDNTAGENCELCKPGYRHDSENNCVREYTAPLCDCDARGAVGPCDERGYCECKQNVEGQNCDTCRAGTFGLDASNPLGCYSCYCSGVTSNCHEASSQYIRVPMAAPVFGDDYGGYTLMDVNAERVLTDHIVSMPTESELMYVFSFPPDEELYWSLPVFPGNRILSYGGTLQLKQKFESRDGYATSEPGTDVILVGDDKSLYWTNSLPIRAGKPLTFKVPLTEQGWYLLNYATPASRNDLLAVLKSLRRVLVRATLTRNIESSSIADVSMDTATDMYEPSFPPATGVEVCVCPEGYSGTSCESCLPGYYKDQFGCQLCNCNGHDCYLTSNYQVVCNCRPPYTGNDCSILGDSSKQDNGTTRPPPPRITVVVQITSPTIKIQNIGSTVNFTCQAMSQMTQGNLPVTWSKDDGYLPQGRYLVDERLGTLTITNLQISDSGKYICQTSDGISSAQAIATLKVPGNDMTYPNLEIRPPFNDYFEGDRIQLECVASGNPTPTVTWQRSSGRPLPAYAEIIDELFIIENAREEDSGEYRCIVSNALGSSDRTAVVNVRRRPSQPARDKLTVSHPSPTVDEGQTTKLVCTGTANVPAGTIDWIRQDGTQFQNNVRSDNGVLYINTARLDNQGVYVCQTSSYDVSPVLVVVTVIPKSTQAPELQPNITVSRDSLKIPTGGNGFVECNPRGYPLPRITWRKYEGGFGPNTHQRDNTLIIANASENDQGYYLCEGTVDGQPVANIYVYVEIEKREQPQIEIWPQGEQAVTLGGSFDLRCRITAGIPEPDVTWSRAGGRPLSRTTQLQPNNILRFEQIDVNDEGEYSCTASNIAGASTASATIRVRSPPEVTITPSDYIEAVYGDPVTVECRAQGYPEPMVSIKTNPDMREIVAPVRGMAVLRISSATERDNGDYICSATSLAGTIEEQFGIRVERGDGGFGGGEGSGEIDIDPYPSGGNNEQPSDLIAFEGQETRIGCDASSNLDVQWSRADRRPLQPSAQQSGSYLIIRGTSKQDAGQYVCNLYDRYTGEVVKSAATRLFVMAGPRIILQPPTQTVHPGESPTVECIVEGDEIQDISWRPLTRPFSNRVEVRRSTLIFNRIEVEDAGLYECFAKNRVGNTTATAEVVVSEEYDRAPFESHDNEQQAHVGAAVHLSCNVHTSAGYRISWTKDGMKLPRNVNQRRDGSLYIRLAQKSDSGRYVCDIQDKYGRRTSNYINLHIDGDEDCTDTQFRCYDKTGCVDVGLLCDGERDCPDNSDEENCILREKRIRNRNAEYRSDAGPPSETQAIVSIDQPRRQFRVGENVELLCRARSREDRVSWERYGTRQYVESRTFGGGAMLVVPNVQESDAGKYRCTGTDPYGRVSFEDFNLEVQPGNAVAYPDYRPEEVAQYTVRQGDSINMPCSHNLEQPVHVEWRREFTPLQPEVRQTEPTLHLERIVEADAGTYVCRVSNSRTAVETRAVLRVAGVVPRFDGGSWISLPTIENAYRQFDIEISFRPIDSNGLILYNSERAEPAGDYLALQLVRGAPQFIMDVGDGPIVVDGDRPLQLNVWHTIRISKTNSKVIMDVDNNGPASVSSTGWDLLELKTPLYIGGVPDYNQLPAPLAETSGFIGCVSMLILGKQQKNIMLDKIEQSNVLECDSCNPNLCNKNGVCQEAQNERGYECLCGQGFAGLNCDRTGEACRQGLCGLGKCTDTADGYKCACPVTYTGKNCDVKQSIEYPAFTGSAYLAIKAPRISRLFRMSMKVKAASPLRDGIIMYSAESPRGYGGFTALNVHNGHLEFIYDVGDGSRPVVLTSNRTLPVNEWTDVRMLRVGSKVTLTIDLQYNFEDKLESSKNELNLETPMFVGGADDSIVLNKNIGVTGGFRGCIKAVRVNGLEVDVVESSIQSANVQECSNYKDDRGDIPEAESVCSQCRNGGECSEDGAGCICPAGFSGQFCENYVPPPARRPRGDPCLLQPCRNGGSCRRDYSTRMNYTCDCMLGFAGTNCQMPLLLDQSVAFNGNGYVELPANMLRYDGLRAGESVLLAIAFYSNSDGVLIYQREIRSSPYGGDFIIIRIENGFVVMEWDLGGGVSSVSVDDVYVLDLVRHWVIAKLYQDGSVSLTVDTWTRNGTSTGFSNLMNADSNIYLGGIPESLNVRRYPGLSGCVKQVELMISGPGINLGREAVAGRNTQRCREP